MLESLMSLLPVPLNGIVRRLPEPVRLTLEEIRIREERPLEIGYAGQYRFAAADGRLLEQAEDAYRPGREQSVKLLDKLSNHSLYTLEEELRRGYVTVSGGHRVGLSGRAVLDKGAVRHIRDIVSFNIRVAREIFGVCEPALPLLLDDASRSVHQTLLLSPPGCGKTTMLRDIARHLSYGKALGIVPWPGRKVAIVDERSELAASINGVPSFDVGPRTDVLDACPKAEGMMMMIRSMSPDIIVVDEIGRPEDAAGIHEALLSGVRVVASAHGADLRDAAARPVLRELIAERRFSRYVILGRRSAGRQQVTVLDADGRSVGAGVRRYGADAGIVQEAPGGQGVGAR